MAGSVFVCPHCDATVEFLAGDVREAQCDCGAIMEPAEPEPALQQHPHYHRGFYDAQAGEPIWPGECTPKYAAGWHAFWDCRAIAETLARGA